MRSIYTITKYVCLSDSIDFDFWGFIIGLITLIGGTGLALFLYLRTKKDTHKEISDFNDKLISERRGLILFD